MSRPGVLLDRDGTIIADDGYVGSVERVRFLDGAVEAIAALNAAGVPVAVVTNQAGVARGHFGMTDVEAVHAHIDAELARAGAWVDLWLFCPYHPEGIVTGFARASWDRKPGPGMAYAAAEALDLDLSVSWVVGDRPSDIGLARAVGARPIHIASGAAAPGDPVDPGVTTVPDLATAVALVLSDTGARPDRLPTSGFPRARYESAGFFAHDYSEELARALATVDLGELERAAKTLLTAYERDAAVFACGNGGSASIANHLQCDHGKGVRTGTDLRTRVISLSTNIEVISAIANDMGYESVFRFQLESLARPGDVLVVISSSGRSPNIVEAMECAHALGLQTIALTGFEGGPARELASASIHVRSDNYGVVEDAHQVCMHLLAQYVRQSRIAPDLVASTVF
ncbi:HAD-IIIA family hydrolase [Nocardioides panaciterrulae]|uniref:D-sedoheptulose 7-phosphate isomerase/D-glycero-D-manno-heptose 1,7-bisphosphate phosphatase n=1 Tax=Nocardioides panaciterrulae TaxID=661492 RepID=A0A7Y9JC55_9ACTN|nr:HAD-IIIA family hydrolase [Nocardioides panaciterrulae]NYD43058.1 D-sedoheptulose 7-phosphate isomerase/D-glycero-D-manno-heptose 1,7-bisphosphate phosphatase [Nocardioides panaciterrulae]